MQIHIHSEKAGVGGRVGEGGWLSQSGRSGCGRSAPPGWDAGDPGFSLTSGSGKQPPGQGVLRVSRDVLLSLARGRHHGGWGGAPEGLFISGLLILGAGCKLVGSGSRKPRHKELEREPLPPRFWVGPPSAYPRWV